MWVVCLHSGNEFFGMGVASICADRVVFRVITADCVYSSICAGTCAEWLWEYDVALCVPTSSVAGMFASLE